MKIFLLILSLVGFPFHTALLLYRMNMKSDDQYFLIGIDVLCIFVYMIVLGVILIDKVYSFLI